MPAVPAPATPVAEPSSAPAPALTRDDLQAALVGGQLEVWFQPKIEVASGAVAGAEALLRWRHPGDGVQEPAELLAAAERLEMSARITRHVLDGALRACAEWLAAGRRVPVAVNVTPTDLADPSLPGCVQELLDRYALSGDLLILEITEGAVLQDLAGTTEVIERLRRLGVALSIDDFGVGYSSMARLVQLQLAELKVDMSLVLGLHVLAEASAAVRAIIDLGHALGMRVVAEGVENERTLTELRSMGCDLAQGYHFTPALPAKHLLTWVADRDPGRASATAPAGLHACRAKPPALGRWFKAGVDAVGRWVLAVSAAMLLVYVAWQVFRWGGAGHQHLIGDLSFVPLNAAVIVAAVMACRAQRHDRATKWAWGVLAAAFTCYLAGSSLQMYYELGLREPVPFPSWADAAYLISYPLILIGLLRFPTPTRSREEKLTLALDTAIVAVGGLALIWSLDLAPMAAAGGDDALTVITSLAYPAGDLVLMFGAVALMLRDPQRCTAAPLRLLLLGFGAFLVTDIWHSNLLLNGGYQGGDPIDTGWIFAQVLLVLAAVAHARRPAPPASELTSAPAEGRIRSRLPYLAVAIAYALLAVAARRAPMDPLGGLILAAAAITGLVTLRQMASMRENMRLLRQYHILAATDGLTGLHNRRYLLELAESAFAAAHHSERPLSLLMIDIDNFKKINDRFGHHAGDQILCAVAEACRSQLRPEDLVGRYGGDELIAVLLDTTTEDALHVAARLQSRLNRFFQDTSVGPVPATLSIGVAGITDTRSLDALLARADIALYTAKREGRNCIRSYA